MTDVTTIFVMPTEEGMPPRAILGNIEVPEGEELEQQESTVMEAVEAGQHMAVFSNDVGCWTLNGSPLPPELSDAISDHARNLGVPGF